MIATTWRKQAACRGLDVEAFYPVTEDEAERGRGQGCLRRLPGPPSVPGARPG